MEKKIEWFRTSMDWIKLGEWDLELEKDQTR